MLIIPQRLSFRSLVLSAEVPSARFVAVQTVPGHQLAQFEEIGQTERLFELLVEILVSSDHAYIFPEILTKRLNFGNGFFKALLGTCHTDVLPHDVAQFLVDIIHRLFPVDRE